MLKNWFGRRNRSTLRDIEARLHHIEDTVQQVAEHGYKNHIHIDAVHLHHPVLRKLEFRLDALDIEELSGALNLGNNFGVRVSPKVNVRPRHSDPNTDDGPHSKGTPHDSGAIGAINQTPTGYTLRFTSK